MRRSLLQGIAPDELGGGMVDDVSLNDYQVSATLPEREEAGTPNIIGAVQLGAVLNRATHSAVGMNSHPRA